MDTIVIPALVAALAGLVLVADIVPADLMAGSTAPGAERRGMGAFAAAGLLGACLAAGYTVQGVAFGGTWCNDDFTIFVQRLVLVAGAIACAGSIDHGARVIPRRQGEYYFLLLCSVLGMTLLAGARDLVLILVAFELMSIPQYVLAAIHKDGKQGVEGATKLYLTGAVSAAFTVYGASFLIGAAGSTHLDAITTIVGTPLGAIGALFVLAGMAYKIGAVPFHMWVPDTYQSAPAPFVAFLSVAPKVAVMAALVRVQGVVGHGGFAHAWGPVLVILAVLTLVFGNIMAIPQTNVRRLLAWSGISHAGLLLLALSLGSADGVSALLFYLATYVVSNMGAFLVAEAVGAQVGDDLRGWNGLSRRSPGLALSMLLCILSLGGIPFVAGFWGKLFVFRAAWAGGQTGIVLLGALLAVVGLFYYLKVARAMYMEPPTDRTPIPVGRATLVAIALALVGVVGLGVVPGIFWEQASAGGEAVATVPPIAMER